MLRSYTISLGVRRIDAHLSPEPIAVRLEMPDEYQQSQEKTQTGYRAPFSQIERLQEHNTATTTARSGL